MSTIRANTVTDAAGTGSPNFPNGLSVASPALTGTPTAPTATVGTNTTQIATTAFVLANGGAAGEVSFFAMSSAPTGWLKANGAAVSRTTYAALFTAIGTTFGVGDGSTTFNVPELRGEFIRALADGRAVDTGRALGSAQGDVFKSHQHTVTGNRDSSAAGSNFYLSANSGSGYSNQVQATGDATETRPRNVALLACIKY